MLELQILQDVLNGRTSRRRRHAFLSCLSPPEGAGDAAQAGGRVDAASSKSLTPQPTGVDARRQGAKEPRLLGGRQQKGVPCREDGLIFQRQTGKQRPSPDIFACWYPQTTRVRWVCPVDRDAPAVGLCCSVRSAGSSGARGLRPATRTAPADPRRQK